jgi:hypothetical protein
MSLATKLGELSRATEDAMVEGVPEGSPKKIPEDCEVVSSTSGCLVIRPMSATGTPRQLARVELAATDVGETAVSGSQPGRSLLVRLMDVATFPRVADAGGPVGPVATAGVLVDGEDDGGVDGGELELVRATRRTMTRTMAIPTPAVMTVTFLRARFASGVSGAGAPGSATGPAMSAVAGASFAVGLMTGVVDAVVNATGRIAEAAGTAVKSAAGTGRASAGTVITGVPMGRAPFPFVAPKPAVVGADVSRLTPVLPESRERPATWSGAS